MSACRVVVCVVMAFLGLLFLPRKSNGNPRSSSLFINIDLHTRIARARMGYGVWAAYRAMGYGLRIYGVDFALSFGVTEFPLLFLGENSTFQVAYQQCAGLPSSGMRRSSDGEKTLTTAYSINTMQFPTTED